MRMSCNGCRVLRKGCSESCSIRPCLQWIKNPESQANATVFLAKFYGRAGLINLINAGPDHLRPAIFRSLLYEACGRIVNPIYGSVGLLWSGSWHLCQAGVEAVLKGAPIVQISSEDAASTPVPPLKAYDIRHVSRESDVASPGSTPSSKLHKVHKTRGARFKRSGVKRAMVHAKAETESDRHELSGCGSHVSDEASNVSQGEPADESQVELELTLGFGLEPQAGRAARLVRTMPETRFELDCSDDDTCHVELGLEIPE